MKIYFYKSVVTYIFYQNLHFKKGLLMNGQQWQSMVGPHLGLSEDELGVYGKSNRRVKRTINSHPGLWKYDK